MPINTLTKPLGIFFVASMLVVTGVMPWLSAVLAVLFVLVIWAYLQLSEKSFLLNFPLWIFAIILGVVVGSYHPLGFEYPTLLKVDSLYVGGKPLAIHLNIAKVLAGYSILLLMFSQTQAFPVWIKSLQKQIALMVVSALLIIAVAYFLLDLDIHIKPLRYVLIFSLCNLLAVCVVEEAFMRLLLQQQIQKYLSRVMSNKFLLEFFPLLIATAIFVLTHGVNTWQAIVVFGLAGFAYGLIYSLTRQLWLSVALHFLVNFLHFTFLTYPL